MNPRTSTLFNKESKLAFWMLFPTFIIVFAFIIFPVIWNLWLSLKPVSLGDLRGNSLIQFNLTLENYWKVLADQDFMLVLGTTLIYTFSGSILSILLGLLAALLVQGEFPGRNFLRGLFISPYVAPVVAVTFTWSFILDPQLGVVNWFDTARFLGPTDCLLFPAVAGTGRSRNGVADTSGSYLGDSLRGMALFSLRLPVHPGKASSHPE